MQDEGAAFILHALFLCSQCLSTSYHFCDMISPH